MPQSRSSCTTGRRPTGTRSRSCCEECGLPYEIKPVNIGRGDQFKPEFLAISPNNRMPAIVDPDGPGGKPISVFEFGRHPAVPRPQDRQVLSRRGARARAGGANGCSGRWPTSAPTAGKAHHFRNYAQEKIQYGIDRYTNEVHRLYGVHGHPARRTAHYLAGDYSIADMATYPWVRPYKNQGQDLAEFPNLEKWFQRVHERPAVAKAVKVGEELRSPATTWRPTRKRRRSCSASARARPDAVADTVSYFAPARLSKRSRRFRAAWLTPGVPFQTSPT